ncbi:MAG: hypothetical protein COA52_09650 [Hyphomicrobiales bacterium]|nr:MAG: hypothetical protein COA52_09650 [Hyphomicrobiales bacterium]
MSDRAKVAGVALLIGAMAFAVRAASAYNKAQGNVWLDYQTPEPSGPPTTIDLSWLDNVFGGGGGSAPLPFWGGGGGGYTPAPTSQVSNDVLTLARTIYGEAASENNAGKEAVANVVINRVRDRRYPSNIASVCRQSWQFSCWNAADPMRARIEGKLPGSSNVFDQCIQVATQAENYQLGDRTGGATHYHAKYIADPFWVAASPNARISARIGVHIFYTGID